ncbi:hypothetical protein ES332_A01G251700v1 [Gossypium tomentosum]|uniref:Uncharacterized protein n=1 Tax=Gossypium tomentosum TaxID=34277 RepID=A0A5D2RXX1_GOSTO|nr:hypothetical protein ES332_A01G251700v1 [Gossypium tomentosum]
MVVVGEEGAATHVCGLKIWEVGTPNHVICLKDQITNVAKLLELNVIFRKLKVKMQFKESLGV